MNKIDLRNTLVRTNKLTIEVEDLKTTIELFLEKTVEYGNEHGPIRIVKSYLDKLVLEIERIEAEVLEFIPE